MVVFVLGRLGVLFDVVFIIVVFIGVVADIGRKF